MDVRFLITDYDSCAYSSKSKRKDKLNQPIVDMAVNGNYDGFYGCTHRAYNTLALRSILTYLGSKLGYYSDSAEANFPTHKITEHLMAATSLPLQKVSTLDDILYGECGKAYDDLILPYETSTLEMTPDKTYLTEWNVIYNLRYKNQQLVQIAKHAKQNNPNATSITLDYVDDTEILCTHAKTLEQLPDWPSNVYINIYHFKDGQIIKLAATENEIFYDAECNNDCPSPSTPLQKLTLFASNSISSNSPTPEIASFGLNR